MTRLTCLYKQLPINLVTTLPTAYSDAALLFSCLLAQALFLHII